jgi:hypothetical protein
MSLILDALNKSDQDRPDQPRVPGLQSQHGPAESTAARPWLHPWSLAVLCLVALLAAVVLWPGGDEPPAKVSPVATPEPALAPPANSASPAGPSSPVKAAAEPAAQAPVEVTPPPREPAAQPDRASGGAVESLYAEARRPAPAKGTSSASPPTPVVAEPEVAAGPGLDVEAIAEATRQELTAPAYEESDLPLVNELSQRDRDAIPSILFTEHTWSPDPAASVVTLNGKRLQEGGRVAPGLTLVSIHENSIVLEYRGTEFRLRSLNSWVNL